MGNETISRTTFAKGLTAGVVVAASLGILSIGEYTIGGGSDPRENGPSTGSPKTAASAALEGTSSSASGYVPGTYTASAAGISSDVSVSATFDETSVTAIEVDVSGETAGIGADIGEPLVEAALEAQSTDFDVIAGATITSDAFKTALADCIAQAAGGSGAAVGYTAGTYTASAKGMESDVSVTVTFDENGITDITTDVSGETAGIGADAGDALVEAALEAQSAEFDGVSGATITSDAFKSALADCIAQAAGGTEDGENGGDAEAAEDTTEAETENAEDTTEADTEAAEDTTEADTEAAEDTTEADTEAAEDTTEADTEAAETETEADTEASETETEAGEDAVEALSSETASFVAGTYTASAKGMESDVSVTVTVDANGITDITTDVSGETAGIGAAAGDALIKAAMDAQSDEFDGVSGATITSDAFKTALDDCLTQAFAGAEDDEAAEDTIEADAEDAEDTTEVGGVFTPGTYSASAKGMESDVSVTVTVDENGITDITTDVSGETAGIGAAAGDALIEVAMDAQSDEFDGVSGATITSDAFKEALADCLVQAQADSGDAAIIGGADGPTAIFIAGKSEDETETEESTEDESEAESEGEPSPEGPFNPGEYTATAKGIDSDITVTMTFDETRIIDMTIDVSGETAGIGAVIGDDMLEQILAAQSADVDGISGATITSDAVKKAAEDCFAQAAADEDESETEALTEEMTEAASEG